MAEAQALASGPARAALADVNSPALTLAFCALLGACALPELAPALRFDRAAATAGESWRLATAALSHGSFVHLAANLAVIAPAGWWIERAGRADLARTLAVALGASALLLAASPPGLAEFSGASGIAIALVVFAALRGAFAAASSAMRAAWCALLAITLAKLAAESLAAFQLTAPASDAARLWPASHWAGAAAAAVSAQWAALRSIANAAARRVTSPEEAP